MTVASGLTPTNLMAAATEVLTSGGYEQVATSSHDWNAARARLFEDRYNIVGVAVFETCAELFGAWTGMQGSLVDTISRYLAKGESKSWDGYLVLMTPGMAGSGPSDVDEIRYNTMRLRKLVATGDELRSVYDVERVLRPLLPIGEEKARVVSDSVLELLPKLLLAHDIPESRSQCIVDAFESQAPLLERLHETRGTG